MNQIGATVCLLLAISSVHANDALPIFDAHLHNSHDACERISPEDVVTMLRKSGVRRASTNEHLACHVRRILRPMMRMRCDW